VENKMDRAGHHPKKVGWRRRSMVIKLPSRRADLKYILVIGLEAPFPLPPPGVKRDGDPGIK